MAPDPKGRSEVSDGIRRQFPETGETILAMAAFVYMSKGPLSAGDGEFGTLMREDTGADLSDEGIAKAMRSLGNGFHVPDARGRPLALDYRGYYTDPARFSDYEHDTDMRPRMDTVLLTTEDGRPRGLVPLPEGSGMAEVCDLLKDFKGTIVTDRLPYSDGNRRVLDRWGTDWLLTEPPFPATGPAVNAKMSHLTHEGREYETCKVRYDKHWLFRFTDTAERDRLSPLIRGRFGDGRGSDRYVRTAGMTDAISAQSFDIRRVRELLDIRRRNDALMREQWRQMNAYADSDRDTAFVNLCLQLIAEMLR